MTPGEQRRLVVVAAGLLLIVVLAALAVGVTDRARETGTSDDVALGVFRGTGAAEEVRRYEQWLGRPVTHVLDYVGGDTGGEASPWAGVDDPGRRCRQWAARPWQLVLSVAILPTPEQTLDAGAAGDYDIHWRRFGAALVANGCADTILRLGWEFNARFFNWAAGGKEAEFVAYWRRIVAQLRSVPGQRFLFDWCPLMGNPNADVEAAYPGDDYVDFIGLDSYDGAPRQFRGHPHRRWSWQLEAPYGLAWHRSFANERGKPRSFPEWGVTERRDDLLGGGDNPHYIERMRSWIGAPDVAYAIYFEVDARDAAHRLMTGAFPRAADRFRVLFGGA